MEFAIKGRHLLRNNSTVWLVYYKAYSERTEYESIGLGTNGGNGFNMSRNSIQCERLVSFSPEYLSVPNNYYIAQTFCLYGITDGQSLHEFDVQQQPMYGPDCLISVGSDGRDWQQFTSKTGVHQNYCFLEAGEITVTHKSGPKPIYTIIRGSYSDKRGGQVKVTGFDPP